MQLKALFVWATALLPALAAAQDAPRMPVTDVRVLLIAAIDSPTGEARGVFTGDMAKMITDRFKASGPILIDVTTQKRFSQAGCSRLNVHFSQDGVVLPGNPSPQAKSIDIGLNYCRDGLPPKSTS
ncbi:hypothetical protein CDN99_12630 [Roseateles aquatilis]|uniref:Uncharacterized protein n=1 Tax=Roseateles aquatilis TaxID=431061 RepID=A0A246JEK0_9BURK|nr:hypothetical protein [Burkholderiaceae bacterium]OWQ90990.1 hypothetical protein CDN99_12630 [Roseateles aquatilis]